MKITFTSGAWADIRTPDQLTAKDKLKMLAATRLPVDFQNAARPMVMSLDAMTHQEYAVVARVVTAWSYDYEIPANDPSVDEEGRPSYELSILQMPLDDWNELEEALAPHLAKLRGGGPKSDGARTTTTSGSGASSRARAGSSRKA